VKYSKVQEADKWQHQLTRAYYSAKRREKQEKNLKKKVNLNEPRNEIFILVDILVIIIY
jgi:hypothetical protein